MALTLLRPAPAWPMLGTMGGWKDLAGRVAIVTGASSGIGAAVAVRFGRERMRVSLAARRLERLQDVAKRVTEAGGMALVVPTDVRDPAAVEHLVAVTQDTWGRIDVLVANAGVGGGPLLKMPDAVLRELVEVNLLGVIRCARAVLPVMLRQGEGHIITTASVAGRVIAPGSVYGATKAGVLAFSDALRRAYSGSGVTVSALLPGWVETELLQSFRPPVMLSASVVADAAVRLLRRPRRELVIPGWYRFPIWVARWFPQVVDLLAPRVMRRLERNAGRSAADSPGR
ncbi:MAG: SDR family NAD(P)-dependent oxidoreductase [Armatimonadota bacterium]|nr:SDR family NAD(P)-dependent oxidoreductase [Armatimonadota bacterium]